MTAEDRVRIIADFGFTDRQAQFLELVVRHAGVCVPRQYARFASIANGSEKCYALFDKLIRRGYAVASACVHNRARLYHVRHKPLYSAIGEPESRYRRPVPARQAVERLMLLDAAITAPGLTWLTTEPEKRAYHAALTTLVRDNEPASMPVGRRAIGAFPRLFPIGVEPSGRAVLLYLVTDAPADDFRMFLQSHAALLRDASAWTIRLVFPRPLERLYSAYQQLVREELDTPLHRATVNELRWYFDHRQKAASSPPDVQTQAFLDRAAQVYGTPRFTLLYRRWLKAGDAVFDHLSSPVIANALACGQAGVECLVLPHTYRHLSPVVDRMQRPEERLEEPAASTSRPLSSTSGLL